MSKLEDLKSFIAAIEARCQVSQLMNITKGYQTEIEIKGYRTMHKVHCPYLYIVGAPAQTTEEVAQAALWKLKKLGYDVKTNGIIFPLIFNGIS